MTGQQTSDDQPTTSFHLATARANDDGSVTVGAGGLDKNGCLWTGIQTIRADSPDHGLWLWFVKKQFKATITSLDLPEFRKRFEKES